MTEKRIQLDQVQIQVREYGSSENAVIFLHFGGANLVMWEPIVPYFQSCYHVILMDLRGHGRSGQPESGYHIDIMASDIIGVMDALQIQQAHLIGSSMGAEVALSMAANHPVRVRSLVLEGAFYNEYGPYGIWQGSKQEFDIKVEKHLEKIRISPQAFFPSPETVAEERKEIYTENGIWNEAVEAMLFYGVREMKNGKYVKSWGKKASEDYTRNYYTYRFEDYYMRVKCPILMLPEEDSAENKMEKAAMRKLITLAQQVRVVEIKGWIHPFGWLLIPEEASKVVLEFLSNVEE